MNKSRQIWLNSLIGIALSALLFFTLWKQVQKQLIHFDNGGSWWQGGKVAFLYAGLLLMPINISLEVLKWKLLVRHAQPLTQAQAWKSYLAGIALSLLTPNRIGEYPGRILYLRRRNTVRLISVSILGAFAQFIALFFYGTAGLLYYSMAFPGYWQTMAAIFALVFIAVLVPGYFWFERWIVYFEKIRWLQRFSTYRQLMQRFTMTEQLKVLGLSLLRFGVYTAQLLLLLRWMQIQVPVVAGFFTACLYFCSLSFVPSIAFAELGVRGHLSLFFFHHFTENTVGILVAVFSLWMINLIMPALAGSVLLLKIRLFK